MKKLMFVILALLLCVVLVLAQEYDYFVYLPMVLRSYPPMPTPTPTPTSTPPPLAVHILPNHSYYTWSDSLWIVGEVQNDTSHYLSDVWIGVGIFDSGGQRLDTSGIPIELRYLPPGEKTCFEVLLEEPASWSYYRFEATIYQTDGHPLPNITLLDLGGFYYPTEDEYKILGQVRNDHGTEVRYVRPVGTLYNAVGTVVGCDYTYPTDMHLNPGQISSFQIRFYRRGYADVTSYRVQVYGNPQ